jgi:hypothetical protein
LLTDDGLHSLRSLTHLESLFLSASWNITVTGIRNLLPLRQSLRRLELRGCDSITDDALEILSTFESLRCLDLRDCSLVTDEGLKHLCGCELQTLDLSGTSVSDFGVRRVVSSNPGLQSLNLWGCDVTDASAATIGRTLSCLESLDVFECERMSNYALECFSALRSLRVFHASSRRFTIKGLASLQRMSWLEDVHVALQEGGQVVPAKELFPSARRAVLSFLPDVTPVV